MLYKFNPHTLKYDNVTKKWIYIIIGAVLLAVGVSVLFMATRINDVRFMTQETKEIVIREANKENEFSPEKLRAYLLELNIKFPHIVYAQARLESGNFNSGIFKENHNLFGMKIATRRPTTNKGEENGHAYYESWKESVVDYAFYQAAYLSDIKSETEYLEYLKASYAESPQYMEKLLELIAEKDF